MKKEEIQSHWLRSLRSLSSAKILFSHDQYPDAVSRAYYAVLHAARAALLVHDVVPKSHGALRQFFGQHLVNGGEIEKEWAKILSIEYRFRSSADYESEFEISNEIAEELLRDAERFIQRMKKYLESQGVVLPEDWSSEK